MTLRLNGDSSGFTEIKAPNFAGDNSITLPTGNGSANQLLKNSGTAGELQYTGNLEHTTTGALLLAAPSVRNNFFRTFSSKLQIEGIGGTGLNRAGVACVENTSAQDPAYTVLARSGGPGLGSNALVAQNQWVGVHSFQANDGVKFIETASIKSFTNGATGTDVMPGNLIFATNGGGNSLTERVEIDSSGNFKLLAGCTGIDFSGINGTASAVTSSRDSEILDGYERGKFNPFHTTAGSYTGESIKSCTFVRIGKFVQIDLRVEWTGTVGVTALQFNLPFASHSDGATGGVGSVFYAGNALFGGVPVVTHVAGASSLVTFYSTSGGPFSQLTLNAANSSYDFIASFAYIMS